MNLPPAPAQYLRDVWQQILNEFRRENDRNIKSDAFNRFGGVSDFASELRITGVVSPAQITADQNNYSPSGLGTSNVLRLSSDAARSITGVNAGAGGALLTIVNVGLFGITLVNDSGSSSASNRFALGSDLTIPAGRGTHIWYDAISSRWRTI
jgi:hypothetical protein